MERKVKIKQLFFSLFLSILGISLWLVEIIEIKKWEGLKWLNGNMFSPYFITILVVFSFQNSFLSNKKIATKNKLISSLLLYFLFVTCYEIGKNICFIIYCRYCFISNLVSILLLISPIILYIILGILTWFISNKYLIKVGKRNILFIIITFFLAIPLSYITIEIFNGNGTEKNWVDIVKIGYPIFWTIFLSGIIGITLNNPKKIELD